MAESNPIIRIYFAKIKKAFIELPDNLFFEITGNLQLMGFVAAWYGYRVFSNRPHN